MMNATKITILASLVLIISLPAWGASKYGDASIKKGKVIVLRSGKRLTFNRNDRNVQINHQDVVRLGQDSSMVLSTDLQTEAVWLIHTIAAVITPRPED